MDNKQKILIGLVVTIIVIIIGARLLYESYMKADSLAHREICRRQMEVNSYSTALTSKINCPPLEFTINADPGAKQTKKAIADLMADARFAFDPAWDVGADLFYETSGTFCVPYAIMDFKDKGKEFRDFGTYLAETKVSETGMTYMQYFSTPKQTEPMIGDDVFAGKTEDIAYSTDNKYAILFVYTKKYDDFEEFMNNLGTNAMGTQYGGAPATGSGTIGKTIVIVGGGVVLGTAAVIGTIASGGGLFSVVSAGAFSAGGGAVGLAALTTLATPDPQTFAGIFFVPFTSEEDLQARGCANFPVALGTRPQ